MHGGQRLSDRARGLQLAELLATRFSHDLSGPLTGLAVALGEAPADAEALALAQQAAAALRRRLALLRAAWGAPAALSATALRELAQGLPNAPRLQLELAGPIATAVLPPVGARLLLNVLLLAAESLPRGGAITLEGDPAQDVMVGLDGAGAGWPEGLAAMLADPDAAWTGLPAAPRGPRLQAALTALLAQQAGARLRLLLAAGADDAPPLLIELPPAPA